MSPATRYTPIVVLALSCGAHLAGFGVMGAPEQVQIQGGAPQTIAMLGDSLADMVQTTTTPVENTDRQSQEPVDQAVTPPVAQPVPAPLTPAQIPITRAARADEVAALPTGTVETPVEIPELAPTEAPATTPAATPRPEVITAVDPVEVRQADQNTPRPKSRPDPQAAPKPTKTTEAAKPPPRQPNANPAPQTNTQTARKGQADGQRNAKAVRSSASGGASQSAGNAAASNYPGKVLRKIQRTRKERAGGRGTAKVGFSVTASGGVTALRILRSSGSARVDQNALRHIKRAAPFAPPPRGAQTSFSVDFVSKG